jgi:hypothetical protein
VQVRICQFAEEGIHKEIELGGGAPLLLGFRAQLFERAERVELAVIWVRRHMNIKRTFASTVNILGD